VWHHALPSHRWCHPVGWSRSSLASLFGGSTTIWRVWNLTRQPSHAQVKVSLTTVDPYGLIAQQLAINRLRTAAIFCCSTLPSIIVQLIDRTSATKGILCREHNDYRGDSSNTNVYVIYSLFSKMCSMFLDKVNLYRIWSYMKTNIPCNM
jgi:hypothetical protein